MPGTSCGHRLYSHVQDGPKWVAISTWLAAQPIPCARCGGSIQPGEWYRRSSAHGAVCPRCSPNHAMVWGASGRITNLNGVHPECPLCTKELAMRDAFIRARSAAPCPFCRGTGLAPRGAGESAER